MKIKQTNKQIIDWITVKRHRCIYKMIGENTFVTNGYIGYLLRPDELLVDTDKMENAALDERIFKNEIDARVIVETGDAFYHEKELYDKYKFQAVLYKDGTRRTFKIHRLVGKHFIENPKNLPEINHLDGVKSNNHVSNLEWCTRKENMRHASENGLMSTESFRDIPVIAVHSNGERLIFESKKECSSYFGFGYWWYHNQVKYHGSPFEHKDYLIKEM